MPPTAPNPQASRAGLITSLVIFVVLFVTATIFAIYFGTQMKASDQALKQGIEKLRPAVREEENLIDPEVSSIMSNAGKSGSSGILLALAQRDAAAKIITGNASAPIDVVKDDAARVLKDVRTQLSDAKATVPLSEDNLLADLKALGNEIVVLARTLDSSRAETKAANDLVAADNKKNEALLADKQKDIDKANDALKMVQAESKKREDEISANVETIKKDAAAQIAAAQQQTNASQTELTKTLALLKKTQDTLDRTSARLAQYRLDPNKPLMHAAGIITRVPGDNTVFINLGQGDGISQGMTFEVYDKKKGLPPLTVANASADNTDLPAGKSSIEVIRILPGASECRVIKTSGYGIVEGDLCVNLVYNTHTHFNFLVYGDFDLANTGQPNPADAEVVRRLVTQWGGKLSEQVTVDTDLVILGSEPKVTPLGDSPTPIDEERHTKQQAALEAYLGVRSQAIHLTVPILNQNRFLYFVGYFDQAKR